MRLTLLLALALGFGARASTGTRPHEMSVAGREAAAKRAQIDAALHRGQYDPRTSQSVERWPSGTVRVAVAPCWTRLRNPTDKHLDDAEKHLRLADQHRAAAGMEMPEMPPCPLLPDRVTAPVEQTESGPVFVAVTADNLAVANEVWRRAEGLAAR